MTESDRAQLAEKFKGAFRTHPAAVALVAGYAPDGPVGLTLSSVASVSVDPAVLSFSVTRATGSAGGILSAPSYVVHLLSEEQAAVADAFARSGEPRFTSEQGWERLDTGEPYLPSARVAFRCTTRLATPVGPSSLILADVHDIYPGTDTAPLLYEDRRFLRGSVLRDAIVL